MSLTWSCSGVPEGISLPRPGMVPRALGTGWAGGGHGTPCAGSWHLLSPLVLLDPSANALARHNERVLH